MRPGAALLRMLFFLFLAAFAVSGGFLYGAWQGLIADAPEVDRISISPSGYATYIFDAAGNQMQKLTSYDSNRTAVSLRHVPEDLQHAVVAIEDERFYLHHGIDPKGLLRAAATAVSSGFRSTQGASTITQQLLKNNVFTDWTEESSLADRVRRKVQEQYLAVKLEEKLKDKDLILENYLNTINMGAGTYGVQAAAKTYFNKDVWELNLSECAVIAGITQNPGKYNPIRHPEENAGRRERVLRKMLELGYITEAELQEALADDVYTRIAEAQTEHARQEEAYSWFVDELTAQVVEDLMKQKGYSSVQAYQLLYSGGLRIYTTQDRAMQAICDEEYKNPDNFPEEIRYYLDWALSVQHEDGQTENYSREMLQQYFRTAYPGGADPEFDLLFESEAEAGSCIDLYKKAVMKPGDVIIAERTDYMPQPQSSLVVMDQKTGYVKALVGGRGEKNASLTLNRATGTFRQPGSTFKILSTYAAALDSGAKNLGSCLEDAPYQYATGEEVHNADNSFRGWVTIRDAIADSINIPAVRLLTQITPARGYQQLLKFGITSLDPDRDVVQPLALGGISRGVTNLELTAAYAAIANGGLYTRPIFYTRILNQQGEVIIDNTPETRRAVTEETAYLLTDAMTDVVKRGTGKALALDSGMPVAGKTGTTSNYNDVWFVGYTPWYTMGVWAGFDNNEKLPETGTYREYHKTLWKRIMTRLCEDRPLASFEKPSTVVRATCCGLSGQLPSAACAHVSTDLVSSIFAPVGTCTLCGRERAEDFDESRWKAFTDELIEGHHYEEIPREEFGNWTGTERENDRTESMFDIVTEDAGIYGADGDGSAGGLDFESQLGLDE